MLILSSCCNPCYLIVFKIKVVINGQIIFVTLRIDKYKSTCVVFVKKIIAGAYQYVVVGNILNYFGNIY